MKQLPLERLWTGDGRGAADAVTHKQLKRTDTVALYSVTNKHGVLIGHEVFQIKQRLKGQALPGGLFELEDREVYPSANSFGKSAWAPSGPHSLKVAEKIFDGLVKGQKPNDADEEPGDQSETIPTEPKGKGRTKAERPLLNLPELEFSVKELAEKNKVEYATAFVFIKEAEQAGTVKRTRSERRAVKGKETQLFQKN